jgi:hypothetical protein
MDSILRDSSVATLPQNDRLFSRKNGGEVGLVSKCKGADNPTQADKQFY